MKLNVISKSKKYQLNSGHFMWVSLILFFSIIGCYLLDVVEPNSTLNLILIIAAITPIATNIYGNYEYFPINYEIISELVLEPTFIKVGSKKIVIDSIDKVELDVNDWHGKRIVNNHRPYGSGPKLSRGIDNKLEIYSKEFKVEVYFQLESKQQFQELANWVKNIYQYKIQVLEKYDQIRSYGLEHLSFAKIQEFKNRYAT